jgi:hypothetical protein
MNHQRLTDWYRALPPRARSWISALAWRIERIREERGAPFYCSDAWHVIHRRGFRLTHARLGAFSITRTWPGPITQQLSDYWPPEVRRALQEDLHRAAFSQDLQKFRWHWDKWARRGYLDQVDDDRLRELMALAARDHEHLLIRPVTTPVQITRKP